jgi:hypothetical protein
MKNNKNEQLLSFVRVCNMYVCMYTLCMVVVAPWTQPTKGNLPFSVAPTNTTTYYYYLLVLRV